MWIIWLSYILFCSTPHFSCVLLYYVLCSILLGWFHSICCYSFLLDIFYAVWPFSIPWCPMMYCAPLVLSYAMMACVLCRSRYFLHACMYQAGWSKLDTRFYVLVLAPVGSIDGTVRCWDTRSRRFEAIQVLDEATDGISSLKVSQHELLTGWVLSPSRLLNPF